MVLEFTRLFAIIKVDQHIGQVGAELGLCVVQLFLGLLRSRPLFVLRGSGCLRCCWLRVAVCRVVFTQGRIDDARFIEGLMGEVTFFFVFILFIFVVLFLLVIFFTTVLIIVVLLALLIGVSLLAAALLFVLAALELVLLLILLVNNILHRHDHRRGCLVPASMLLGSATVTQRVIISIGHLFCLF